MCLSRGANEGTRFDENYDNPDAYIRTYERVYLWRPADGQPVRQDALAYYATLQNDGPHDLLDLGRHIQQGAPRQHAGNGRSHRLRH